MLVCQLVMQPDFQLNLSVTGRCKISVAAGYQLQIAFDGAEQLRLGCLDCQVQDEVFANEIEAFDHACRVRESAQ